MRNENKMNEKINKRRLKKSRQNEKKKRLREKVERKTNDENEKEWKKGVTKRKW